MAIAEYVEFMAGGGRGPGGDELRRKARDCLLSSGWTLYKKAKCDGRQELRYQAPHGASYISLIVACKKFQQFSAAPPRTAAAARGKPGMKRKRSAAADCCNGKAEEAARVPRTIGSAGNGGCKRGFGGGDDECGPAVRNPFSGECRGPRHRKMRRVSALYADEALKKYAARKRKKASSSASPQRSAASPAASPVRVLRPRTKDGDKAQAEAAAACQPTRARTILAVLMDKKIVPPKAKLSYKRTRDEPPVKQGSLTAQGTIRCACGCGGKAFTVAEFAAHALGGECGPERPSASVYLNDGRSLSQCLVQLMRAHGGTMGSPSPRARLKRKCPPELEGGDWVCSVCADFGDVLLCDSCPSTFHHGCVGLDATPEGEWFCPSCRCAVCGSSEVELAADGEFTHKAVIYCDQCEREYHAGCIRSRGDRLECCPEGPWLCSHDCSNVFQRLQGLVGRSIPTSVEGLTITVLRSTKLPEEEAMAAEEHGRLCAAFDVLHECFVTLIEPQTGTDLSHDIVFNRESELRRLNFRGFYVVGIEKGGELITVGTLRVYGKKVAELPLVGTRFAHRRQGMCRLLINQLEKLLGELGVERLVLPAVPELLQTWTGSFGFQAMSHSDKMEIAEHTLMCFQGTTMCQKFITAAAAP